MTEFKTPIPLFYQSLATDGQRFKRYVVAYISRNVPGYKLVRIEDKGRTAVCIKDI